MLSIVGDNNTRFGVNGRDVCTKISIIIRFEVPAVVLHRDRTKFCIGVSTSRVVETQFSSSAKVPGDRLENLLVKRCRILKCCTVSRCSIGKVWSCGVGQIVYMTEPIFVVVLEVHA